MFHVPSRPAPLQNYSSSHDAGVTWEFDVDAPMTPTMPSPSSLNLPRTLSRPSFVEVDRRRIAAVAPELADVPSEYVRRNIAGQAKQMMNALAATQLPSSSISRAQLPNTRTVPVRLGASHNNPTHVLAIVPAANATSPLRVSHSTPDHAPIVATHALVMTAHCAHLPSLPNSSSSSSLPLVTLTLPSPSAFPALHAYLYTTNLAQLLTAFIPSSALPPQLLSSLSSSTIKSTLQNTQAVHSLATALARSQRGDVNALLQITRRINGLWRNATALGVFDTGLWDCMDFAWEIVLGAINLAASGRV